jgi:hypothetical protein
MSARRTLHVKEGQIGVILSLGKAGWSTWNTAAKTALATDPHLVELVLRRANPHSIVQRAQEIYPHGQYGAAHSNEYSGLNVTWVRPEQPFRVKLNSAGYEEIEYYKEDEWICA